MGILDDAIRQHLELKRKHGASGDDLQRLEKEAFGPSTRPGDPDAEADEAIDYAGDDPEAGADVAAEPISEEFEIAEEWDEDEEHASSPDDGAEDVSPAEQARVEHSHLDDTVDHPAVEPSAEESDGETESAEHEVAPPEPPETAIFDQGGDEDDGEEEEDFGDLDLELDIDEPEPEAPAPPAAPAPGTADQPPTSGDGQEFVADEAEEDELEDEDEDLLEETPEFLQDTPEGERLWFEQGKPKDFDFDDD